MSERGPVDDGVPSVARIYDHFLGGAHNFAHDRAAAERIEAVHPDVVVTARANRNFLRHAVEHALDLGVRQFLDLGSGIPTVGNVHEVARRRDPSVRVAYVDDEAVAVAHSETLLEGVPGTSITDADLCDPDAVLAAPGVAGLLDLTRPVALLAVSVLHFVPDAADPAAVLGRYRRVLAPGSLLALTHSSADYPGEPDLVRRILELAHVYANTSNPGRDRSRDDLRAIVEGAGFRVGPDGFADVARWAPPPHPADQPLGLYSLITEPLPG